MQLDTSGGLGDLVGLHRADYAGDWSTVCVIVRARPEWMPTAGGMPGAAEGQLAICRRRASSVSVGAPAA